MTDSVNYSITSSQTEQIVPPISLEIPNRYYIRIASLLVLGVFGLVENVFVLRHLYKLYVQPGYKLTRLQNLVLALTLTNFGIVATQIPEDIIWHITVEWKGGTLLCKGFMMVKVFLDLLSTFLILSLSVDRCLNLSFPLTQRLSNPFKLRFLIIGSVAVALVSSIPQAVVYTNAEIPGLKEHFQCTSVTSFTSNDQRNFYNIIYATLHFFVPLLVTVACYACVVFQLSIKARKRSTSSKAIGGTQNGTHDGSIYSNKSTRKCSLKMNNMQQGGGDAESKGRPLKRADTPCNSNSTTLNVRLQPAVVPQDSISEMNEGLRHHCRSSNAMARARNRMLLMTATVTILFIATITPYYVTEVLLAKGMKLKWVSLMQQGPSSSGLGKVTKEVDFSSLGGTSAGTGVDDEVQDVSVIVYGDMSDGVFGPEGSVAGRVVTELWTH
ncbi:annetocin receptor-like [Symsagittifera roscoffensis]|uniref:annetocin receptor-like n=1 Tax=Symsagittifera roscoffensis TaxID=84072 RepID=UPI00307B2BCC